ncbi:unnamed protein product (macronuclear) [Paramecium tetraurelia]|uniref:Tetratricopeptide repeat protein n=1 Tax=Paramecium tetraurelia TaxID=5888 RepID=A0DET7_PARTE|nr:uncharacterized protein GSPATT00016380001 [Paramecium tetraurelia]CAK81554.1 unnamed protein product [Paramecium tetraurelia]|eukprot:XP_001448951.1 hypothetical protein (macronuclear) [Paramecium tetraurelia strain d4-2]
MIALGCHSINLGQKLLQQQKRNQALYWFDAAISLDPNMVDSLCGKGDALQQFDKYQKAIQWYDRALGIAPNHVSSLVGKGNLFFQSKMYSQSTLSIRVRFQQISQTYYYLQVYLAKVLSKQKTESSLFERGKQLLISQLDSLEKLKLEQRFKEKEDQTKEKLDIRLKEKEKTTFNKQLEAKLSDKAKALHQYKIEALLQGKPKPKHQIELEQEIELELESQKYFDQALSTKPNQVQALTGKGDNLHQDLGLCVNAFQKQIDAEVIINKALSLPTILGHNEKQSDIYAAKGTIQIYSRRYFIKSIKICRSQQFLRQGLRIGSESSIKLIWKRLIENYEDAIEWYDKAIKIKPNHVCSIWGKGESLRMQDKFRKAIIYFDRALKYHPKHFLSLYGKGILSCRFEGEALRMLKFNYDASVEYKQALELQPNHIKGLFGYGEVLKLMRKYPQSLVCYKKILEIDQGNMEAVQLKYEVEHCISQLQQKESINTLRKQDLQSNSKFFDGIQTNTVNFRKKL